MQDWDIIYRQLRERNEEELDIRITEAFFKAGWEVYPESGYRFQLKRDYEDGYYIHGLSKNEAKKLFNIIKAN